MKKWKNEGVITFYWVMKVHFFQNHDVTHGHQKKWSGHAQKNEVEKTNLHNLFFSSPGTNQTPTHESSRKCLLLRTKFSPPPRTELWSDATLPCANFVWHVRINNNNEPTNPSLLYQRTLSHFPPAQPNPHPLSIVSGSLEFPDVAGVSGQYIPHGVTVSLDTSPIMGHDSANINPAPRYNVTSVARGYHPQLGQLLEAAPLVGSTAAAVTCVKFSPSADFCLLGYGVRELTEGGQHHLPWWLFIGSLEAWRISQPCWAEMMMSIMLDFIQI
jgi:hypothetical protein